MLSSFQRTIENRFPALVDLAAAVADCSAANGVAAPLAMRVDLAVEELITNIIKYGFDDAQSHEINVALNFTTAGVELAIIDDGHFFDPTHAKPSERSTLDRTHKLEEAQVGGWGLELVRKNASTFTYERDHNHNISRLFFGA
jgi:anti-sigma regulatory factor (Ser/Thr protein kinase)